LVFDAVGDGETFGLGFGSGILWDAILDLEALGRDVYFVIVVTSRSGEVNFVPYAIF